MKPDHALATRCAHAGATPTDDSSPGNVPYQAAIAQTSLFRLGSCAEAEAIFSGAQAGFAYTRFGNPTVQLLAETLAELEAGAGGLVTSSGNAAVLCAVTAAMAGRRGPLLTHPGIYGGSFELLKLLAAVYRLELRFIDPSKEQQWAKAIAEAGAVLVETPSNPLMHLVDLSATAELAQTAGAPLIVDNTVATPFNQRPFECGADWVIHSTTKYLNGHSDMVGGVVIKREELTSQDRAIHKNLGGTVNALDAWLILRGLRTFALRMQQHNANGLELAAWLRQRPELSAVHYPGSANADQQAIRERQMRHPGSLLAFELAAGEIAATRLIDHLKLIVHGVSLGGMESLITRPAASSHRGIPREQRIATGISDGLIRLSVGTEAIGDLVSDLDQALAAAHEGL